MGKPASSSSVQGDNYVAVNVTTEDDSRWNSYAQGASGLDEWVMADLGSECTLDSIRLGFPRKDVGGIGSDRYYTYAVYIGNSIEETFTSDALIGKLDNRDKGGIENQDDIFAEIVER